MAGRWSRSHPNKHSHRMQYFNLMLGPNLFVLFPMKSWQRHYFVARSGYLSHGEYSQNHCRQRRMCAPCKIIYACPFTHTILIAAVNVWIYMRFLIWLHLVICLRYNKIIAFIWRFRWIDNRYLQPAQHFHMVIDHLCSYTQNSLRPVFRNSPIFNIMMIFIMLRACTPFSRLCAFCRNEYLIEL